jgi:ribonuclease G
VKSELFVSRFGGRTWAVLREDGITVELRVDDDQSESVVGRLMKGRVAKVLPGMQAAFIDIGLEKDAFLHIKDLHLPGDSRAGSGPIQDRLKPGRELLVQIERDSMRSKGVRVSCQVTLPGRYLVHMPHSSLRSVSRKVRDENERSRLKQIVRDLPLEGGFIVRTAGMGAEEEAFQADAAWLAAIWTQISEEYETARTPAVIHQELDMLLRLLRGAPRDGFETIWVDREEDYERAVEYLRNLDPAMASKVRLHIEEPSLFEAHELDTDIAKALHARVWLKSGGYIVIEPTEALVSIDVNTGKYVGKRRPEETILRTNLEAAAEIGRQLRLRDLGGIIVVDFIDMEKSESRRKVIEAMQESLRSDRARTKVVGISELGLLQLTRKRTRSGPGRLLTRDCPSCGGLGRIRQQATVAYEVIREISHMKTILGPRQFTVRAHPDVLDAILLELQNDPAQSGDEVLKKVRLEGDGAMSPDTYDVMSTSAVGN